MLKSTFLNINNLKKEKILYDLLLEVCAGTMRDQQEDF